MVVVQICIRRHNNLNLPDKSVSLWGSLYLLFILYNSLYMYVIILFFEISTVEMKEDTHNW